jgi:hypothetical protein
MAMSARNALLASITIGNLAETLPTVAGMGL